MIAAIVAIRHRKILLGNLLNTISNPTPTHCFHFFFFFLSVFKLYIGCQLRKDYSYILKIMKDSPHGIWKRMMFILEVQSLPCSQPSIKLHILALIAMLTEGYHFISACRITSSWKCFSCADSIIFVCRNCIHIVLIMNNVILPSKRVLKRCK